MSRADLPGPWRRAHGLRIAQRATRSALGAKAPVTAERIGRPGAGTILVLRNIETRCGQPLEAYGLPFPEGIALLLQPMDMHPKAVAMCDELNDVAIDLLAVQGIIGTAPVARQQIRAVYLRGDAYAGPPSVEKLPLFQPKTTLGADAWYDPWKRAASEAWSDYRTTFSENLPWNW